MEETRWRWGGKRRIKNELSGRAEEEDEGQMNEVFATDESPRGVNSCMDEKMRVCEDGAQFTLDALYMNRSGTDKYKDECKRSSLHILNLTHSTGYIHI